MNNDALREKNDVIYFRIRLPTCALEGEDMGNLLVELYIGIG